jgi:phosphohistidine phosphatase
VWIHLLRHGIAVDPEDPACPADPERYLTDTGKARTRAAAKGMAALGISPDLVLVSPYVRAQQTAEIAVAELGVREQEQRTVDALVPMGDPAGVLEAVQRSGAREVLCVGHAPNLDLVVARTIGAPSPITRLKKAGMASLQCTAARFGGGVLFAVYPSSVLRKLGER